MKFSFYILVIYLICLAVIPCCGLSNCPDDQKIADNRTVPDDSKKVGNACSPFFNCGKCEHGAGKANEVQMDYVRSIILSIYSEFIPSRLKAVYNEFWHSPRYC